ncbi:MAG: lysophospholipid acyltransferase family protein [Arcobacteraceae bacterium]|jgi:1-acyl-sn-glycerol-3-phosphate acyltransferase|nr:lysophospholipid acyltransferase family protein [Arcobacteraceae bacterium]
MSKIRGILILIQFAFTVSITIILMYIFRKSNRNIRKVWANLQLKLMGANLVVEGSYDKNADMLIFNHQSMMDIILFEAIASRNIAWIAKKEIGNIPWFGHILKAPKMIMVERESKKSLIQLLKDVKDRLEEKRQICIFPEGTRTDGKNLRKFKAGAKVIAEKYNLKVQPIVIIGSIDVFDSKRATQKSGDIRIVYLPTIQADKNSTWYEEVEATMATILQKNTQER